MSTRIKVLTKEQIERVRDLYIADPNYSRVSKLFSDEQGVKYGPAIIGCTIREFFPELIKRGTFKVTEEQKSIIAERYANGVSVNAISKEVGLAFDTTKKYIESEFKSQQNTSSSKRKLNCPDVDRLREMAGSTEFGLEDICQEFKVSRLVVPRWIEEHDIEMVRKSAPPNQPDKLYERYRKIGCPALGRELGIHGSTVLNWLMKHGIDRDASFSCSRSRAEIDLAEIIGKYFEIQTNQRKILDNKYELDIFIPEKNLAVEFNGLYWHSEKHKPYSYHYDKWLECNNKGIQLLQIWEDDWEYKKDIVKQMLLHKLSISDANKIYARNCQVVEINQNNLKSFMDSYHIQGSPPSSSVRLGLLCENMIVAAISFTKAKDYYTLTRYATNSIVVGGFTKLLKSFENLRLTNQIVTFADLTISNGSLYKNSGFMLDCIIPPDYSYYANNRRVHKFNYRKSRFQKDNSLLYEDGLTERQLAELNKLYRIYDAGKLRYVKKLDDR